MARDIVEKRECLAKTQSTKRYNARQERGFSEYLNIRIVMRENLYC
jgi:hypothetical protein